MKIIAKPALLLALAGCAGAAIAASEDPQVVDAMYRGESIITYQAWVADGHVVIRANHNPGWHTYALDNVERARDKTGREEPETELPTVISADGLAGDAWLQSDPLDLSKPEMEWFTWGFEGESYFAAKLADGQSLDSVKLSAQACTDAQCAMIEDLEIPVSSAASTDALQGETDLSRLVPQGTGAAADSAPATPNAAELLDLYQNSDQRFSDYDLFVQTYFRTLDHNCDGQISLVEFADVIKLDGDHPRQLKWMMAFDGSGDGIITLDETAPGFRANSQYQVDRLMAVDVDGDKILSEAEFELSMVDLSGEAVEGTMTGAQKGYYRRLDLNRDDELTEAEVIAGNTTNYTGLYWGYATYGVLALLDKDQDETLSRAEVLAGFADRSLTPPDEIDAWFDKWSRPPQDDPEGIETIHLKKIYIWLRNAGQKTEKWRLDFESDIRPLLIPMCYWENNSAS